MFDIPNNQMDRIDLFRIFAQVVDSLSFTRAADVLGMPRSSVSNAVQELEARLGVRLLNRTTRRVSPTQEGLAFYDHSRRLLEEVEEVEVLFSAARPPSGKVRAEMPGRIGRRIVAPRLPEFLERHPAIDVMLGMGDRATDLLAEGVDCALRVGTMPASGMMVRLLGELPVITVASPDYLAKHGTPRIPEELFDAHRVVGYCSFSTGQIEEFEWTQSGEMHQAALPARVAVNSAEAYIACCLAGLGLAQLPAYDVSEHIAAGELVEVLPDFRALPIPMALLFPSQRRLPRRTQVFADWLAEIVANATTT